MKFNLNELKLIIQEGFNDAYRILGVSTQATPEEINKAYRKKAKQFHPDLGGDPRDMIKLNAAREFLLKNTNKQQQYQQPVKNQKSFNKNARIVKLIMSVTFTNISADYKEKFAIFTIAKNIDNDLVFIKRVGNINSKGMYIDAITDITQILDIEKTVKEFNSYIETCHSTGWNLIRKIDKTNE